MGSKNSPRSPCPRALPPAQGHGHQPGPPLPVAQHPAPHLDVGLQGTTTFSCSQLPHQLHQAGSEHVSALLLAHLGPYPAAQGISWGGASH